VLGLSGTLIFPCRFGSLGLQPELEREWRSRFDRCAQAKAAVKLEAHSSDGRRDYAMTLVPLSHRTNQFRCCFVVEDVTDQRRKDAEIAQGRRLRALGELVGGIAHEFNNLLTPILIKADQLHADAASNPELRADLQMIVDAAQRSAELTRRLLTFGRQPERHPETVDIRAIITSNVELLRHTIDRRIDIQCVIPAGLPPLFLCASDVHQILVNLLLNARDTLVEKLNRPPTPDWAARIRVEVIQRPNGQVELDGQKRNPTAENWITVTISDNGMGMAPGVIERIFEPFYTTKEVGRGTGLGLATVWYLVTELGGRVDVDSVKGEGSTFFVSIPVNAATPTRSARPSATRRLAMRPIGPPMRILVVDDEPPITQLVSNVLQVRGHSITVLQHGQAGWERLAENPTSFDALIVDLNLPGITGLELTRRARSLPFTGPIIVMSGRVTDDERREFTSLGVSAILEKPFVAVELLNALAATAEPVNSAKLRGQR
jgi:two-component system, cell cycle sensor histidine kinase and response regulator CckA